ncbi:MAG: hypothetical protein ACRD1T_25415, partial [Acidimicrobiia bacterium]
MGARSAEDRAEIEVADEILKAVNRLIVLIVDPPVERPERPEAAGPLIHNWKKHPSIIRWILIRRHLG